MPRNPHNTHNQRACQRASRCAHANALPSARSPTHSGARTPTRFPARAVQRASQRAHSNALPSAQVPCTMFVSPKKTQRENNYRDHLWVSSQARPGVT